jgi:hypothetical protein
MAKDRKHPPGEMVCLLFRSSAAASGKTASVACIERKGGTEQTDYRCRKVYGGLQADHLWSWTANMDATATVASQRC